MDSCFGAMYLSFFIYLLMRSSLFYVALKYSNGEVKGILFMTTVVDITMLFLFPILMLVTGGVC